MYIKYYRNQKSTDVQDLTNLYRSSAKGGDYRPTWLIRVCDWEKVPGTEAEDGYCTLSYCWEQSGSIVQMEEDTSGEYECVDYGRHCIVEKGKKRQAKNFFRSKVKKHVTYEELLQQLCTDFQIDYVWYDKICIDQSNKEAKVKEIKQMHNIYGNALFTLVLVPEVHIHSHKYFDREDSQFGNIARRYANSDMLNSLWWKRSWTLEETMASKRILVVGKNTHFWQHSLHSMSHDIPTAVDDLSTALLDFRNQEGGVTGSVNQALSEAHFRTSSKPHDIIFALANTFPSMFDHFDINYDMDVQHTFRKFYQHIAINDLSILCFGSNLYLHGKRRRWCTMDEYNLSSWTGVHGSHPYYRITTSTHLFDEPHCINLDTMYMHISTHYYWRIPITPFKYGCFSSSRKREDGHDFLNQFIHFQNERGKRDADGWWPSRKTLEENKDIILMEWFYNMEAFLQCHVTHYHQEQHEDHDEPITTRIRPLSLTEDCEEGWVLPILLDSHHPVHKKDSEKYTTITINSYTHVYFLPVFKRVVGDNDDNGGEGECVERFKAIGVYLVGLSEFGDDVDPSFSWNHFVGRSDVHTDEPEEILNTLFANDCYDDVKEFIIE